MLQSVLSFCRVLIGQSVCVGSATHSRWPKTLSIGVCLWRSQSSSREVSSGVWSFRDSCVPSSSLGRRFLLAHWTQSSCHTRTSIHTSIRGRCLFSENTHHASQEGHTHHAPRDQHTHTAFQDAHLLNRRRHRVCCNNFWKNDLSDASVFKGEREFKKHNEWQNFRFCRFCWFCHTQTQTPIATRPHAHGHTSNRQHNWNSVAKEDCSVFQRRSERTQSVTGRAQPRTGRSIPSPKRIVLYFWEGPRDHKVLPGVHNHAREGQFRAQRGLFCTFEKGQEITKCYREGTTTHGKDISSATEDCYVLWEGQREPPIVAGSGTVTSTVPSPRSHSAGGCHTRSVNMNQGFISWIIILHEHPGGHASWRAYDEEVNESINHLLRERTCMQMECPEDAIRTEWVCLENNGFLLKQLENQNSLGELIWRACTGSLGEIG